MHRPALRIALPLVLVPAATSTCFGFAEIARGALLLQTTASATYDSYFLGTVSNDPDTIYTLFPSLRYTRNAGRAQLGASAGVAFNRYEKNQDLDSEDLRANASIDLPTAQGSRLTGSFTADYNESTVIDYTVNDRVATETFSANLGFRYRLGARMQLSESLGYSTSSREIYSDQETLSNTVTFTYDDFLRGTALDVSHGANFTQSSGDNYAGVKIDQQSHIFNVGLSRPLYGEVRGALKYGYSLLQRSEAEVGGGDRTTTGGSISATIDGPFLPRNRFPKLESSASLSYSQPVTSGLNDTGGKFLSGHLSLSWAARERTNLFVRANRSISLAVSDLSVENTRVGGGFNQRFGRATSLSGNVGYSWSTFRGVDRSDNALDAGLSLSQHFNKYLSASLGYTYEDRQSDATGFQPGRFTPRNYERHTGTASVVVTF